MELRAMRRDDWPGVARIYAAGITTGHATFETEVPEYSVWDSGHMQSCRLIAEAGGEVLGWAALSPVSGRCVYGGVAEVSIYVSPHAQGRGVGRALLDRLIADSEREGLWTLQSGIFPENAPSIALHEKAGFRFLGRRERIAKGVNGWADNLIYERRSTSVGTD